MNAVEKANPVMDCAGIDGGQHVIALKLAHHRAIVSMLTVYG